MIQVQSLTHADEAKVRVKLTELQKSSGCTWTYEVTNQQQVHNSGYMLEVSVDGRYQRPVSLSCDLSAERICGELDKLNQALGL